MQSAWESLASQEELSEREAIDAWQVDTAGDQPNSFWEGVAKVATGLSEWQRNSERKEELRSRFEERILDELLNEYFFGFGYPVEPSPARMPRRIDPVFWDSAIVDWNEGKAWLDNVAYNRVRIIDPLDFPQFNLTPKRPGPISYADEINWAIAYHTENEPDFWKKTDSIRINRMRKSIKQEFGIDTQTLRGFGDKTFEKFILIFKKANFE